jgi:hypothetical protein
MASLLRRALPNFRTLVRILFEVNGWLLQFQGGDLSLLRVAQLLRLQAAH